MVLEARDKVRPIESEGNDKDKVASVSIFGVFQFADTLDRALISGGLLSSLLLGTLMPLTSIFLGGLYNEFQDPTRDPSEVGIKFARLFVILSGAGLIAGFGQMFFFIWSSERQALRVRKLYLEAVLSQDISWFDRSKGGEISSQIEESVLVIREAIGEKLGLLVQALSLFIFGNTVGFVQSWKLTLVLWSAAPLLVIGGYLMSKLMNSAAQASVKCYAKAGGIAQEAVSMIRTVASLGIEQVVFEKYNAELYRAEKKGIHKAKVMSLGMSFTYGIYFCVYALGFWYGSVLVKESRAHAAEQLPPSITVNAACFQGNILNTTKARALGCPTNGYTSNFTFDTNEDVCMCAACACGCVATGDCTSGGTIVSVFFSVVMASLALGQAGPQLSGLINAKSCAQKIYKVIRQIPKTETSLNEGIKVDMIKGAITFENVSFSYPSRPDFVALNHVSLEIKSNECTALVGYSGGGKSTVTQLIQRFYDPTEGCIKIDGRSLTSLDLSCWRGLIGVVSQEPILFGTTIAENIGYGTANVSRKDIEDAARAANAYKFITAFPEGFDTQVGHQGTCLSGGQKQRVAIARAIIRNPKILIFDEATSALDNESERVVQEALEKLLSTSQVTRIVIAHRLSTIKNADKIVLFGNGKVLEEGSHEELVGIADGHYAALVESDSLTDLDTTTEIAFKQSSQEQPAPLSKDESSGTVASPEQLDSVESDSKRTHAIPKGGSGDSMWCCGQKDQENASRVSLCRLFSYAKPERWWFIPAIIAAAGDGAVMPIFSILFADISNIYFYPTIAITQKYAIQFAMYFIILGVCVAIFTLGKVWVFGYIGERMTTRIRKDLFHSMLKMDVGFFDRQENNSGALSVWLSTDAAMIKEIVVNRVSVMVENVAIVATGLVIAFYYGWKLTLVILACLPLIIIVSGCQVKLSNRFAKQESSVCAKSTRVLSESVMGIRTVKAFSLKNRIIGLYAQFLKEPYKLGKKKAIITGVVYGISQATVYAVYAIAFLYGSHLIVTEPLLYDFPVLLHVFFAVAMMGVAVGQAAASAPDVGKAQNSARSVFKIVDTPSLINPFVDTGARADTEVADGISFSNVSFAYPTRLASPVLDKFSLTVEEGSTVALVGESGSGKSTAVSLLERFYDTTGGCVKYHGINVKDTNIKWLRRQFALVEQEPKLFETTVFENIAYGVLGQTNLVTQEMVENAAKSANAHEFIMKFPEGYQTIVGGPNSSISGGQKQRICIARCLIRDPKVLLLDEATSALDNESEAIVQDAIENMTSNSKRTCIIVAHRLTTIQKADIICVFQRGKIVEKGTHSELFSRPNGEYRKLFLSQIG